jgi:hypothetical protein
MTIDDDLKKLLIQGDRSTRRKYARQLADNALTTQAYERLACCYQSSFSETDRQHSVRAETMKVCHQFLGYVLAEIVCTHGEAEGLGIKLKAFVQRVQDNHGVKLKYKQSRVYVRATLRLLALYKVLREAPVRSVYDVEFDLGSLPDVFNIFEIGPRNWQILQLVDHSYENVTADRIEATLKSLNPCEKRIIKAQHTTEEDLPPAQVNQLTSDEPSLNDIINEIAEGKRRDIWLKNQLEELRKEHDILAAAVKALCEHFAKEPIK